MINILKLRKLEKENKQRKLQDETLQIQEPIKDENIPGQVPTVSTKSSGKGKKPRAPKKTDKPMELLSQKETINLVKDELTEEPDNRNSIEESNIKSEKESNEEIITNKGNNDVGIIAEKESGSKEIIEDNPVEAFRQNLLKELLNSDSLPEFSNSQYLTADEIKETLPAQIADSSIHLEVYPEASSVLAAETTPSFNISHNDSEKDTNNETSERIAEVNTGQPEYENNEIEKNKKIHDSLVHLVSFSLGKENYGVDIMRIREIIRTVEITKVPRAPEFIEGVINLRGSVIPVVNLRTRIKLPRKEYDKSTRIIVLELKEVVIGFIVDEVKEVLRIPQSVISPPPVLTVGKNVEYITAVAKLENCLIILIEPERLLSGTELEKLK